MKNFALAIILMLAPFPLLAQTVTLDSVSAPATCDTAQVTVYYTASGSFGAKNVFTLQVSSDSSFKSFSNGASLKSTVSGSIMITLPKGSTWIRVASSNPYIASDSAKITVNSSANANFYIGRYSEWVGDTFTFQSNEWWDTSLSFKWNLGEGATPATSTDSQVQVSYSTPGTKTVTLTVSNGTCSETTTQNVEVLTFTCFPSIPATAIIDSTTLTIQNFDTGRVFWVVPGGTLTLWYGWHDTIFVEPGGTVIGGNVAVIYLKAGGVAKTGGSYLVYEPGASIGNADTLQHQCSSLAFNYNNAPPYKITWANVSPNASDPVLNIYPNPATNLLTINAPEVPQSIIVRNDLGAVMLYDAGPIATSKIQFDVSRFAPGVYYVELGIGNRSVTSKFTISR